MKSTVFGVLKPAMRVRVKLMMSVAVACLPGFITTTAFTASGYEVSWAAIIVTVAVAQWLVFAWSAKKQKILISTGVFIAMWLVTFDGHALIGWKSAAATPLLAFPKP